MSKQKPINIKINKILKQNKYYIFHHDRFKGKCFYKQPLNISDKDVEILYSVIGTMILNTEEDMILFCTALQCISAKQKRTNTNNYSFKKFVVEALNCVVHNKYENIKFKIFSTEENINERAKHGNNVLDIVYIQVYDVQFSFHVNVDDKLKQMCKQSKNYDNNIIWDRIPKQNGAKELFLYCLNLNNISTNIEGVHPKDYAREMLPVKENTF